MPRKGYIAKREVLADPLYNSIVVTKLINNVMEDGKKGIAQRIVYDAFAIIQEKSGKDPVTVFEDAMNNIMPLLEVKSRRIGGSNYQVPIEVRPERRQTLALRWMLLAVDKRSEKYAKERLAAETLQITQVLLLRREKMYIEWQKLIRRLLITDISLKHKTVLA